MNQVLAWITTLHGFLSSPTGGGVRHGTQLAAEVTPTLAQAHLYCNLTKSYINYLLAELAELRRAETKVQPVGSIAIYSDALRTGLAAEDG